MNFTLHDNGPRFLTCPAMDADNIKHMFSTRVGGVSGGCFSSWNFAEGASDTPDSTENVLKNYAIAANVFGMREKDVCRAFQTHSANVLTVDKSHRGIGITSSHRGFMFDGLVTAEKGIILSVRTADCVPVLLCDSTAGVIAAVHSGWRGTAKRISAVAVEKMVRLGACRGRIVAAIGPCAGVECYRVGNELRHHFTSDCFAEYDDGCHLDLVYANTKVLLQAGIAKQNIYSSGCCTVCDEENFFSHRRDGVRRGVMAAFITL